VLVRFPAYRRYSEARIEVNDAMMALLIGARLGEHALRTSAADPSALLPSLFGQIAGIARVNRTAGDAARLLGDAEKHLAYMAIPYALTVHSAFLVSAARMLRDDRRDEPSHDYSVPRQGDLTKLSLDIAHEYIAARGVVGLDDTLLALFHVARRIRNRIVHFNGSAGSRLAADYKTLPKAARASWEDLAGRPLPAAISAGRLELAEGELVATLAISRHLAQETNSLLAHSLSRPYWARVVIDDYRSAYPQRFGERDRRVRRVLGHAERLYRPLKLSEAELTQAGL